jgi:uncharacterized protein YlzI (FlbEa/FlbD family)
VRVRLDPVTDNPAVLEKLARVPSSTMRLLNGLKAVKACRHKGVNYYLVAWRSPFDAWPRLQRHGRDLGCRVAG